VVFAEAVYFQLGKDGKGKDKILSELEMLDSLRSDLNPRSILEKRDREVLNQVETFARFLQNLTIV
jgi:hypothetical protein